jgi:hypothetical protein
VIITNDTCSMPEVITFTGGMATRTVDLGDANADYDAVDLSNTTCIDQPSGGDIVYDVTIPPNQTLTVTATPPMMANTDTVLVQMIPMCSGNPATSCADSTFSGGTETLTVMNSTASPMQNFIIVKGYDFNSSGALNLTFAVQ